MGSLYVNQRKGGKRNNLFQTCKHKLAENRNGKPMKQKPKQREEKKKLNIKKRWDHLSSVNAKHWMSLLQNMLHCMAMSIFIPDYSCLL